MGPCRIQSEFHRNSIWVQWALQNSIGAQAEFNAPLQSSIGVQSEFDGPLPSSSGVQWAPAEFNRSSIGVQSEFNGPLQNSIGVPSGPCRVQSSQRTSCIHTYFNCEYIKHIIIYIQYIYIYSGPLSIKIKSTICMINQVAVDRLGGWGVCFVCCVAWWC